MLAKKNRLPIEGFPKKPDKVIKGELLFIKISSNNNPAIRFGVIISSKYDKRAVYRHKLKRKINQFLSQIKEKLSKGINILIILNPKTRSLKEDEVMRELERCFSSILPK